jgi:glycosyltransferase involved in cell wall biosynthesis
MYASVSVIIPCYRCVNTIERAVASVANQTLVPMEVILVDDSSGDKTLEKLQEIQEKYHQDWVKVAALTTNSGPAVARNTAWDLAQSQYLAFLDADDSWHPEKIAIQYQWMKEHSEVVLSGHQVIIKNSDLPVEYETVPQKIQSQKIARNQILISNKFCTSSVMIKREISQRFNPGFRYSQDYHLWLDIILAGNQAEVLDFPICYYFKPPFGAGGQTKNLLNGKAAEKAIYHNLLQSKKITFFEFYLLSLWSLAKYYRRVFICKFRD